jgi:hypothetical protein
MTINRDVQRERSGPSIRNAVVSAAGGERQYSIHPAACFGAFIHPMAMDPLGAVSPLMDVLRRQMSENLTKLRQSGSASGARTPPRIESRPVAPNVRQTLARRLRSMDPRDPQFQDKATALFVQSILTSEFGEELVNDAGFRQVIRDVALTMREEPAIAEDLARLFEELRG